MKGADKLKKGFTTGTCSALAAKAAARMIFRQAKSDKEFVLTPKGIVVETKILFPEFDHISARCAVKKYSGDDPDVTNGIILYVYVRLTDKKEITIDGGKGVGRVTKKGLWQNIGEAAINKVPKQMITEAVKNVFDEYCYEGGADIIISVPDGEKIADKTFNPRLGITGGISILGTSGIVEPMSESAIVETIKTEINVKKANGSDYIMISPGNYGFDFIKKNFDIDLDKAVKCGNFIGEALDFSKAAGFDGILLIGHIGKFVKLAGGIMNTHSKNADGRMEIFASNTALICNDISIVRKIIECFTTDDAVEVLKEAGICDKVMDKIVDKALFYVKNRLKSNIEIGIIMFSNIYGVLGKSYNVYEMIRRLSVLS